MTSGIRLQPNEVLGISLFRDAMMEFSGARMNDAELSLADFLSRHRHGGHHEELSTDLCAHTEFTIPTSSSAMDREEHPYIAPLLGQTARTCVGGNAATRRRSATDHENRRVKGIVLFESFSIG
jgi:hypothetical protein